MTPRPPSALSGRGATSIPHASASLPPTNGSEATVGDKCPYHLSGPWLAQREEAFDIESGDLRRGIEKGLDLVPLVIELTPSLVRDPRSQCLPSQFRKPV